MRHRLAIGILLCWVLYFAPLGIGRAAGLPQNSKANTTSPAASGRIDACSLLTSADLQTAVGEPLEDAKSSVQPAGGTQMSQCLFRVTTPAKSVSLAVATPTGRSSSSALREFWRRQFHASREEEEGSPKIGGAKAQAASEAGVERETRQPRRIEGLGEEAYWVGTSFTGALYVLQGDAFVRVSIGGIAEESTRLEKSKGLAVIALARFRNAFPAASLKRK